MKRNCWEVMACGLEVGGSRVAERGVCPAAVDRGRHGKNGGHHAGRYCWKVEGTLCNDEVQERLSAKLLTCTRCDFFRQVKVEEGNAFTH